MHGNRRAAIASILQKTRPRTLNMTRFRLIAATSLALLTLPALAQTTVKDAWVRGTVAQQKATGAFFSISSVGGGKLLSASSPAAGVVEIHEMMMDGSTMKMRAVPAVDLPPGKAVELKPGGYHVMLMDLKAPLTAGQSIDLTLVVEGKDGKQENITVKAPVKALGGAPAAGHDKH
jgi:periplasmic copper chaperone A